jgi:hypothetical protein
MFQTDASMWIAASGVVVVLISLIGACLPPAERPGPHLT